MIFISSPITHSYQGKDGPGNLAFSHVYYHPTPPPNDTFISSSNHIRLGNKYDRRSKHNNTGAICTNADIGISERKPREGSRAPGEGRGEISRGNGDRYRDVFLNTTFCKGLLCCVLFFGGSHNAD